MVFSREDENKIAYMSCIEIVLMRRGNANYNLVLAKLRAHYESGITECLDNPEYLKTILKEVYKEEYSSVLDEIKAESEILEGMDEFKIKFLAYMES